MNNPPTTHNPASAFGPFDDGPESIELPPDLAELASQLDAMAIADLTGAPMGLADRAWTLSRNHLAAEQGEVAPVNEKLERLAHHEQSLAPVGLAPQAFELSREAISGGTPELVTVIQYKPAVRGHGVAHSYRFTRRVLAMAASIALVATAALYFTTAWQGGGKTRPDAPTDLATRLDSELSSLFEVVDHTPRDLSSTTDSGGEFETSWLDDIYGKESL